MNEISKMFTHLGDCNRTIEVTRNTLKLADDQSADFDEILRECQSNIRWAYQDLQKVKEFLNPEEYATKH